MAKVKGEDVVLSVNVADVLTPIACGRSITFDIQNDLIETSITGNGNYRTFIPGALDWSGTIEGLVYIYKENNPYNGLGQLYDFITAGTQVTITYYEVDELGTTFLKKEGNAYIQSINETSSFDNMVTFTANIKGTGQINITYGDV